MNVTHLCLGRNSAHCFLFPPKIVSNLFSSVNNKQSIVTQALQSLRDKDYCCHAELVFFVINVSLYLDVHFPEILRLINLWFFRDYDHVICLYLRGMGVNKGLYYRS